MKVFIKWIVVLVVCQWIVGCSSGYKIGDGNSIAEIQDAAEMGEAQAQYELASLYYAEESHLYDLEAAFNWFSKSAQQGYAPAQNELGNIHSYYLSPYPDEEKARFWYQKAAEQGYVPAQVNLAVVLSYYQDGGYPYAEQSLKWMKKAAEQGSDAANRELGIFYREGQIVAQNYDLALAYYRKAADGGDSKAQNDLGEMYLNGEGVEIDRIVALALFKKSADNGNYEGSANYLSMTRISLSEHLRRAKLGDHESQLEVCDAYYLGLGFEQDVNEGLKWCVRSALQGNTDAQVSVARMYISEGGIPVDFQKAYTWAMIASQDTQNSDQQKHELKSLRAYLARNLTQKQLDGAEATANICAKQGHCSIFIPVSGVRDTGL
jgi:TPR repeat protein